MKLIHSDILKAIILIISISSVSECQTDTVLESNNSSFKTQRVIPGKQYDVGWFSRIFSGDHWRDLWATEIDAKVLDMDTFAGGLKAVKKGGGLQSKSLRLIGEDKNEYKFRTMDKFPYRSLPPEWQNSYYADLLQDQVSIGLPVAPLIVYPLVKEVGILAVEPKVVILPNSSRLGVFEKEFAGVLGIIEINPRAGKKEINNFARADKVVNGFEIFEKTEKDNDSRVDQTEFLKARLMDIFLGDRDRHADQWQWAGYKQDNKTIWKPIPRDRDYAFGRYDGFFPWLSGLLAHSLVGFSEDIPQIIELTWSGRHLDRRFLNELDKPVWDSLSKFLAGKLTDDVLKNAVKKMPPEMYKAGGKMLYDMLKSRRGQLIQAAEDFYEINSDVVDICGSNKREYAEAIILNEKEVEISLYKRDKETGKKKGEPFYKRKFNSDYTSEVRLYLLGGDDYLKLEGNADNDILIRVISDKGKDEIKNNSDVKLKVYDSDNSTRINSINSIYLNNDIVEAPVVPIEKYEPTIEDRYNFWAFTPVLDYNSDEGLIIGGGPNFTQHGFRANPYLYYLQLTGSYATYSKDYDVDFYGDFNKLIHRSRVEFFLSASELDYNRFYGFGNQTERNDYLAEQNFYKARQQNIIFSPNVTTKITKHFNLLFGASYRYSNAEPDDNSDNLLGQIQPYGFGKISDIGLSTGFSYINVDNNVSPKKGIYSILNFTYFPNLFDLKTDFSKVYAEIKTFLTAKTFTDITLILKAGGQNNIGNYLFYEAASVGGMNSLRGFGRERFQGDASFFGQSELRIKVAPINLFLPSVFGISGISDIGRVFYSGEDSEQWHSTYGGGAWLEVEKAFVLNFLAAFSPEVTRYYFTFGIGF